MLNNFIKKVREARASSYLAKLQSRSSNLNEEGEELLDPTPMEPPIGWKKTPHIYDMMRAMVQNEISRKAAEHGVETLEESDDFDVDEGDTPPLSGYENDGDYTIAELMEAGRKSLEEKEKLKAAAPQPKPDDLGPPIPKSSDPPPTS